MDNRGLISISEFVEAEIQKLRAFETQWEQQMRNRSPDEMPSNAHQATAEVWRERYNES